MATPKEFSHMEFIVADSAIGSVLRAIDGKALAGSLNIRPVKHGGSDGEGKLKSAPTAREFLLLFMKTQRTFTMTDVVNASAAQGLNMTKQSLYQGAASLVGSRVLKRVGTGVYEVTGKEVPQRGRPAHATAKPKPGERVQDKIIALLQHAPDHSMNLKDIKSRMGDAGASVSPTLATMLKKKVVKRPHEGVYTLVPPRHTNNAAVATAE